MMTEARDDHEGDAENESGHVDQSIENKKDELSEEE